LRIMLMIRLDQSVKPQKIIIKNDLNSFTEISTS